MNATIKTPNAPATDAQAALIAKLMNVPAEQVGAYVATVKANRTKGEASARIAELIAAQKSAPKPAMPTVGDWHFLAGTFFLIAKAQGSGHTYAKARLTEGGFGSAPKGTLYKLSDATKVNASHCEAIRELSDLMDACMFCGLPLDLPQSRVAGYGEKCASNNGLPWGTH